MEIKKGDSLLCKKKYFDCFIIGERYEVYVATSSYVLISDKNTKTYFFDNGGVNSFFFTKEEERKYKLEKLS